MSKKIKFLIVLQSMSYSLNSNFKGVKCCQIQEFKKLCNLNNIEYNIATYKGKLPIINIYKDEQNKNWVNNFLDNECCSSTLIDIKNINEDEYNAIIIPSFIDIYKELSETDNVLADKLLTFYENGKIIYTTGHSSYSLALVFKTIEIEKNNKLLSWPFLGYDITGTSLNKFLEDKCFLEIDKSVEEVIVLKGANFIDLENKESNKLVVECRNVLTAYDEDSFVSGLEKLINKLNIN